MALNYVAGRAVGQRQQDARSAVFRCQASEANKNRKFGKSFPTGPPRARQLRETAAVVNRQCRKATHQLTLVEQSCARLSKSVALCEGMIWRRQRRRQPLLSWERTRPTAFGVLQSLTLPAGFQTSAAMRQRSRVGHHALSRRVSRVGIALETSAAVRADNPCHRISTVPSSWASMAKSSDSAAPRKPIQGTRT